MSKVIPVLMVLIAAGWVAPAESAQPVAAQVGAVQAGAAQPGSVQAGAAQAAGAQAIGAQTAGAQAGAATGSADPRIALLRLLPPGSRLEDLRPSPVAGLYEFAQGADVSYITADGKFFIDGNLYDMGSRQNLTEDLRTKARVALINAVPESQMLIFSPKNPLYTITVFTDVDCGYCRKLHSEMAELNRLGVRVRYMFFPRTGPNTDSWRKAEAVWCSIDRNGALTRAKSGAPVDTEHLCGENPVAREYALGQSIGVRGTPAIVTEGGDYINGYMPPQDLVQELKELQAGKGRT